MKLFQKNVYNDKSFANTSIWDNFHMPTSDVCFAAGRLAFEDNPEKLLYRLSIGTQMIDPDTFDPISGRDIFGGDIYKKPEAISKQEFDEKYSEYGIKHEEGMTRSLAEHLVETKQMRDHYQQIIAFGRGGWKQEALKFGTSVATSFLSPINIATSLIPVGGEALWLQIAAKTGRTFTSIAKPAVSSMAAQAFLEPLLAAAYSKEQTEYSISDSLHNLAAAGAFGAAIGGIAHGFKAFKHKFTGSSFKDYSSKNAYVDYKLSDKINLQENVTEPNLNHLPEIETSQSWIKKALDLPEALSEKQLSEQIKHIQDVKAQIITEAKKNPAAHAYFEKLESQAAFEHVTKKSFFADSNLDNIPNDLKEKFTLSEIEANIPEVLESAMHDLSQADLVLQNKLNEMQSFTRGYNPCSNKQEIARCQFEQGLHIDTDNPLHTESIYAKDVRQYINDLKKIEAELAKIDSTTSTGDKIAAKKETRMQEKAFDENMLKIKEYKSPIIGLKDVLSKVETRKNTVGRQVINGFFHDLEAKHLTAIYKDKHFESLIAKELYNITAKTHPQGFTNSKKALQIAQIIHKWQSKAVQRANLLGANIAQLEGYITRQTHCRAKMGNAGQYAWREFIKPLLKTQLDDTTLDNIYSSLKTGLHEFSEEASSFGMSTNLARKAGATRKLHFKDAEAWLKYNERFGEYKLQDSVVMNLERLGGMTGVMEVMGTNPENMLQKLKNKILEQCHVQPDDKLLEGVQKRIKDMMQEQELKIILGMDKPENTTVAAVGFCMKAWINMCALGRVMLSSIPDIASWTAELQNNGIGTLKSYSIAMNNVLSQFKNKVEKEEVARALWVWSENILGGFYTRFGGTEMTKGSLQKAQNLFFKLNLMEWWDSSFKKSMARVLSNNLAHIEAYASIPKYLKQILGKHNIRQDNYHLTRHLIRESHGRKYIMPDSMHLPVEAVDQYLKSKDIAITKEARKRFANEFTSNLKDYFRERSNVAIPTPGAKEQALMNPCGFKRGKVLGEIYHMLLQFKSFPVAFLTKAVNAASIEKIPISEYSGRLFDKNTIKQLMHPTRSEALAQLALVTTLLGGISVWSKRICSKGIDGMKDLSQAKDFEDVLMSADLKLDGKFFKAALLQGGFLGLVGDLLLGEYDRYGNTFTKSILPPTAIDADTIASIYTSITNGDTDKAQKAAKNWAKMRIPFGNLFYLQLLGLDPKSLLQGRPNIFSN